MKRIDEATAQACLDELVSEVEHHPILIRRDLRVPVKIAQEQLGHASIQTTLNIYTHVVDASHRQAIEAVERQWFPTVPKSADADAAPEPPSAAKNAG